MKRKMLSIFYVMLKWSEKGRYAGIEHFATSLITGLLTFININSFQALIGVKPFLKYPNAGFLFGGYILLVLIFSNIFLPKSYILKLDFSEKEINSAKKVLIIYYISTLLLMAIVCLILLK